MHDLIKSFLSAVECFTEPIFSLIRGMQWNTRVLEPLQQNSSFQQQQYGQSNLAYQ